MRLKLKLAFNSAYGYAEVCSIVMKKVHQDQRIAFCLNLIFYLNILIYTCKFILCVVKNMACAVVDSGRGQRGPWWVGIPFCNEM